MSPFQKSSLKFTVTEACFKILFYSSKSKPKMSKPEITKEILIETLVEQFPFSVRYLMEKGIRCIMCGEPIWGTLEEACTEKNFSAEDIEGIVAEMKSLAEKDDDSLPGTKINAEKIE